jgi:hypothetical protein
MSQTVKTVTATASSVGTAATRSFLSIRNESGCLRVRVGDSSVTQNTGLVIEPGEKVEFALTAATPGTAFYAISEGAAVQCSLFEIFQS